MTRIFGIQDCLHIIHIYFINFVEGVNPPMSEAHCGCTSFHEYCVICVNDDWNIDLEGGQKDVSSLEGDQTLKKLLQYLLLHCN